MSFAILHDDDNGARAAPPSANSTHARSSASHLTDGLQAIPWEGDAVLRHEFRVRGAPGRTSPPVIPPGATKGLFLVAMHDFRPADVSRLKEVRIYTGTTGGTSKGIRATLQREDIRRNSLCWVGVVPLAAMGTVWIEVEFTAPTALSIGEIATGLPDVYMGSYRDYGEGESFGTLTNGPWRTRVAMPRKRISLAFQPLRENIIGPAAEKSQGALRPVTLVPDITVRQAYHGHLEDDVSASDERGFVWRNQALSFTESERALWL